MNSVVVPEFGGPEAYRHIETSTPSPASGQVLVDVGLSGVNYLDVAQRSGGTPLRAPFAAGVEGLGTVAALGAGVEGFEVGQRVGWFTGGQGSFSDFAAVESSKLVHIPDSIEDDIAVAALMQGVTAQYLTTDTHPVGQNDVVLMHAAAGGVGQMLTQIAKIKGATVIGTVSTEDKAQIAKRNGVDHVVDYRDVAEKVKELTDGAGASVVYDGVGATTFSDSLKALRVRGTLAVIGNASGPIPPVDINTLNAGGSLYLTRPTIVHHVRSPEELATRAEEVFSWISAGDINVSIGAKYPLSRLSDAFEALEARRTTGKIILEH